MDIQDLYRFSYYVAFLSGIAGGCLAHRLRPSGKRALTIALVPLLLVMARVAVTTVGVSLDIRELRDLFC
jgi:hypothetical protein